MNTALKAPTTELEQLEQQIDPKKLPRHVAVIMDGNGRWAQSRGWRDRIKGHEAGIEAVRSTTRTARRLGVSYLTLYAFSKENWARPQAEIDALMRLLRRFLVEEIPELNDNGIKLIATGELADLPSKVQDQINKTAEATSGNKEMILNLALSYGGRTEIIEAARKLARDAAAGDIDPEQIGAAQLAERMYRPELPDPDLLIRTSGEMRISNFLLWQIAYTEIHVTKVLWPDFREQHFVEALLDYQQRERRFGKVLTTKK
jgi:undecaprenyl diphosphate synthase